MSNGMETRFVAHPVEFRKSEDKRTISGYAAVFNRRSHQIAGGFFEVIKPGAFTEVLKRSDDVKAMINHVGGLHTIGSRSNGTLRLKEDGHGLWYEVDLPDTQAARDLAALIERGDIRGSSFGFKVAQGGSAWSVEDGTTVRTLTEIAALRDVSPVDSPAYEDTDVAIRSLDEWRSESADDETPDEGHGVPSVLRLKLDLDELDAPSESVD